MNTETFIANTALSLAGVASTIQDLNERSPEANRCRPFMQLVRRQTLEAFDWNFARRRKALALHGEAAPDGAWTYRYSWPSNCVQFRRIWNPLGEDAPPIPFDIELNDGATEKTILSDYEDAIGIFTVDIADLGLTTAHFQTTMATLLASFIAMPTSKNPNIRRMLQADYGALIMIAPAFNANEEGRVPPEAECIRARA